MEQPPTCLLGPQGPCAHSGASEAGPGAACLQRSLLPLWGGTPQKPHRNVLSPPNLLDTPPNQACFSSFSPLPFLYCPSLMTWENRRGVLDRIEMLLFKHGRQNLTSGDPDAGPRSATDELRSCVRSPTPLSSKSLACGMPKPSQDITVMSEETRV